MRKDYITTRHQKKPWIAMTNTEESKKCSHCLKLVSESETDNCEECNQISCKECLTYYGELAFCPKCEKE